MSRLKSGCLLYSATLSISTPSIDCGAATTEVSTIRNNWVSILPALMIWFDADGAFSGVGPGRACGATRWVKGWADLLSAVV